MRRLESNFIATRDKGEVSAVLLLPASASFLLVLGHGAGADMHHPHMESLSEALYQVDVATFRYNFPYMERGGKGRDSQATSLETVRSALIAAKSAATDAANSATPELRILAGGHSFGGRMTSLAQAESPLPGVEGLVFFSFPLHPSGKPAIDRAAHLSSIQLPMLFISGDRDKLAELDLFKDVMAGMEPKARLHLLHTADHSFKILKRSRKSTENIYQETARIFQHWTTQLQEKHHAT
jgi:predicted alpha/beta-hydrolase family hydrolase